METASVAPVIPTAQPVVEQMPSALGGILVMSAVVFVTTIIYNMSTSGRVQTKVAGKKDEPKKDAGKVTAVSNVEGKTQAQKSGVSIFQNHSQQKQNITKHNPVQQQVEGVKVVGKVSLNDIKRNEASRIKKQAVLKRINELNVALSKVGRTYDEHRRAVGLKNELTLLKAQAQLI